MDYESLHEDNEDPDEDLHEVLFEDTLINEDLHEHEEILERSSSDDEVLSFLNEHSNSESESFTTSRDILEEKVSEVNANYPNEAYEDFMILVTKHRLSNATGNAIIRFFNKHANLNKSLLPKSTEQGRKYMDKMNQPSLDYQKTSIITYNNVEYYLYHRNLIDCIKNIFSIPNINQDFALTFENLEVDGEKIYNEQNTAMWWKNTENSLPTGAKLLSLILYSDATNVDTLGKSQLHPIYMTIGNIKNWRRNKPDVKQLLGYLPTLSASDNTDKKSSKFKKAVRESFHNSLRILLDPIIKSDNGFDLALQDEIFWFFPRISVIISDWPEASSFCLTYKSSNSNHPCHFCLVSKDNLNVIDLQDNEVELRTHENMITHFEQNSEHSVSIENVYNTFWDFP
jgi:hypothetical protein